MRQAEHECDPPRRFCLPLRCEAPPRPGGMAVLMILTPIPREQLDAALDRFAGQLDDPAARAAFARIRTTASERAQGAAAETDRREALALARSCGMAIHPAGVRSAFNWDRTVLDGATEAYVILHHAAHFVLAPPERRRLVDFGLR